MAENKKIIEGLWDCPYCGAKGIGGLTKHCPACGHPQDEGTKFYLGEKKNYLDQDKAEKYGKGADWTCSYCGSLNHHTDEACTNCGAPREEKSGDYFDNEKKQAEAKQKEEAEREQYLKSLNGGSSQPKKKRSFLPFLLIIAALAALFTFVLKPKDATVRVADKNWTRSITVEELKTFEESDWDVPDGGRILSQKREIHHYEQVLDHYEERERTVYVDVYDGEDTHTRNINNGDGTFTEETYTTPRYRKEPKTEYYDAPVYRDEPVYATKYYYEIDRWVEERTETSSGGAEDPYWPELNLQELEREGRTQESYTMVAENVKKNKTYTLTLPFAEWQNLNIGEELDITYQNGEVIKINGHSVK